MALGLAVLAAWHADQMWLLRGVRVSPPVQYNAALGFIACGVALGALAYGRRRLAFVAALPLTLGGLALIQFLTKADLGIDQLLFQSPRAGSPPGRIAPGTAIGFLLTATGMLLLVRRPPSRPASLGVGLFGSVVVALGAVVFLGYLVPGFHITQGRFTSMAFLTAAGFVVIGAGIGALAWPREQGGLPAWLPVSLGVSVLIATLVLREALTAQERAQINRTTDSTVTLVETELRDQLLARRFQLDWLALRWLQNAHRPADRARWDAELAQWPLKGLEAVERVEPSGKVRWVASPGEGAYAPDGAAHFLHARQQVLETARDRKQAAYSRVVPLADGWPGLLLAIPRPPSGPFTGWAVGVFRSQELFDGILTANIAPRYEVALFDGDEELFRRGERTFPAGRQWQREGQFNDYGVSWRVTVCPEPALLAEQRSPLPDVTLAAGALTALLLSLAVYAAQTARRRAREIAASNRDLHKEIGERRRAEEDRDRFFTQSLNLLGVVGFDGAFKRLNPAWEPTLGFTPAELLAQPFLNLVHPDDHAATQAEVQKLASGQSSISFANRCRCKDGSYKCLLWNATPFLDQQGFYATGHDVTERNRLEEELRQAHKMEAIGRLAGGVAHDFNNLLTIIKGYSAYLLDHLEPGTSARGPVEQIHKAGDRAARLTQQLLAFSRRQVLAPVVLDLNAVVADTEKLLRPLLAEDVRLILRLDPRLHPVKADRGQMEQVLLNLAVNARDAMPRGGTLTVATANVCAEAGGPGVPADLPAGAWVRLTMTDTGCGMDEATRARVFEPFFTTKEVGKGTGLGLAAVHGIVAQSGGHIEVESEPGKGTTFRVWLRAVAGKTREDISADTPVRWPRGSETVLVVEDEAQVRCLTGMVLRKSGYQVLEAPDGAGAVAVAAQHPGHIHLLVTDVIMPEMSGPEVAQHLTRSRPDLRVLYISGHTGEALARHGMVGAEATLLYKPFSPAVLTRKVREMLD